MSGAQDMPARAFRRPYGSSTPRVGRGRAEALAAALEAGETMVVFKDRRMPVERLAGPAEQALEMADRLARPA